MLGGCVAGAWQPEPLQPPPPVAAPVKADPQITTTLIELLENKDRYRVDLARAEGTPLGEVLRLGSPVGYNIRNRFLNIGVPIAEGLSRDSDVVFRDKLVSLARWDSNGETRAAALIAVAQSREPGDFDIFREALVHLDPAVRFGALEALQVWSGAGAGESNRRRALPLLLAASEKDYEPILRVYAAAGAARLGEPKGLDRLRSFLDHASWLVRAMSGRYLGDLGEGQDYDVLVSRIGRELTNDFVVAEYCIAALKLFPKRKK